MKLVITIPAYNEEKTIGLVIKEIPKKISGVNEILILVVDDGSTDRTREISETHGCIVVSNKKNLGLALTFRRALGIALKMGADLIVNTDADFQYNQKQIPLLIEPILSGEADLVLGSRFKGKIEQMPFQKRLGNILASKTLSFLTGKKISDGQTGFRAFSRDAAAHMALFSNYTYTQESILQAVDKNLSIVEVPVDFRKREGKSRLISSIWVYAFNSIKMIFYYFLYYKPFRLFLSLSLLFFFVSISFGLRILIHFLETGLVSPFIPSALLSASLFIVAVQLFLIGLTSESQKINRHINEELLYRSKIMK